MENHFGEVDVSFIVKDESFSHHLHLKVKKANVKILFLLRSQKIKINATHVHFML